MISSELPHLEGKPVQVIQPPKFIEHTQGFRLKMPRAHQSSAALPERDQPFRKIQAAKAPNNRSPHPCRYAAASAHDIPAKFQSPFAPAMECRLLERPSD